MEFEDIKVGDIVEIKNDTGTYKLQIDKVVDEEGKATGRRWNKSRGCWSKTSHFAIFCGYTKGCRIV